MEDNHGRQQQQMLQWQQPQQLWQSMQPEQWQHQQQQQQAMQQPQQQSMQQLQQQQAAMQQLQQQMKSQQLQQQAMLPLQQQQWQQQQAVKPMKPPPPAPTLPLEFFRSAPSLDAHLSATISRTALESTHHLEPLRTSSIVPLPSCISHTHSQSLSLSRRSTASLPSQLPQASPFQQAALSLQPSQQQQTDQLPQSGYEVGGSATQGSHCVSASGSPNPMAHAFRENSLSADPAWQGSICDATRMLTTKRPSTASRASSLVVAEAVESHRKATSMSYMGQGLEMGLEMERGLQAILLSPRSGVEMASQQAPQPEGPPLQHRVSITLQHGGTGSVASQHSVVGLGGSGVVTQGHPVNAMVQSQEAGMAAAAAGLDPAVMTQLMGVLQQRRAALQRVLADRQAGQQGMSQGQQSMSQEQQSMSQGQQGQQGMSSRQQSMPQGQQGMSLGQQSMPQGQQSMSPGHQGMSPRQQSMSQEQQSMSQGQQGMSPRQQGMPQGQQGMLQGQQGMPLNQQVLPMGQQVMFQGQQVASQGLQGMSQGQQGMPQGQQSMGGNSGFGFRGQGTGMAPAAEGVWPKITLAELQRANFQRSSSRRISSNVLSDIISPPVHGHIVSNRPSLSGHVSPPKRDSLTGMAMFTGMEFNPQPKRQSFNELHTLSDWQSPTSVRNSPNGLPGRPSPHEEALHGHLRPPGLPAVSQPPPPRLMRSGSRRGAYPEFVKDSHGSDVMGSLAAHDSSELLPPGRSLRHTYSGQGSSTTYPSGPLANGFATIASIKQQHPNTSCPVLSPQYQHSNSNTPTTSSFHFNGQQVLGEASSPPNLQGVPWSPAVMGTWLPDQGMAMATPSMGAMYAGQRAGGNAFDGPGLRSSSYMGHGGLHEEADHERTLQAMVQLQALRELAATRALNGPRSPGGLAIMPTEGSNLPHRPLSTTFEEEPEEEDCGDASQGASKLMRKSVRMAETLQRGSSDGELPITRPLSAKLLRSLASSRRWSQSHSDTSEEVGVRPARSLHHRRRSSSPEYVLREDASSTSSDSFRRRHQTTDAEHVPRVALEAMRRSKSLHRSRSRAGALLDAEQEDLDPLAKMLLLQQGQPSEQHGSQSQQRAPQSAQHVAQSEQGAAQSEDRSTGSAQSIGSALEAERAKRVTQTLRRAAMLSHAIGIAVDDFH